MKKNKIINIILIMLLIFVTISNFNNLAYAIDTIDVIESPNSVRPGKISGETELASRAGVILGAVNTIGIVTSVVTLMVLGIKYMLGSVEEKAEYKKTMGMYLIGAFLVMCITTVPNILYKIASNI